LQALRAQGADIYAELFVRVKQGEILLENQLRTEVSWRLMGIE
jgi:hypothetical protein